MKNNTINQENIELLVKKPFPIIEGPNKDFDVSYKWFSKNNDLSLIESGIPINEFHKDIRNIKLEFEVKNIYFF